MDPRELVEECGIRRQGLSIRGQLKAAGLPPARVSERVAAGELVRVRRRVYAVAPLPPLPRFVVTEAGVAPAYVAHVRSVLMSLGSRATACGRTAAALYGWGLLVEPARRVEVAVPHGRKVTAEPNVRTTQRRRLARVQSVVVDQTEPMWLTSPLQTVVDCATALPLMEGVVVADSALRAGAVTLEELVLAAASLRGVREARRVRRVLDLCDPLSGSVLESVLRVRMSLAGITGFRTQRILRSYPELRVDFCFGPQRLVVEVDGQKWHQDPARDRVRGNVLAALGWRVLRYTWAEVMHDADAVLAEILSAVRTNDLQLATGPLARAA